MTKLLDHLYLGSNQNSLQIEMLKNEGISNIINIQRNFDDTRELHSKHNFNVKYIIMDLN